MLERLSERAGGDPAIGLLATLTRSDLAPDDSASAKLRAAIQRFPANRRLPELVRIREWRTGLPATSTRIRPARTPPANPRAASTRTPTRIRSSGRSNQDARRSALTAPCFPPRPSMWPAWPPVGPRSNERRAAWTMPARPPHVSPPSRRRLARRDPDEAVFHLLLCDSLRAGIEKRLESRGLHCDRRGASEGTGRGPHRVTSRPPKRGRATEGRHSPGQARRSALRATVIAVSPRPLQTSGSPEALSPARPADALHSGCPLPPSRGRRTRGPKW